MAKVTYLVGNAERKQEKLINPLDGITPAQAEQWIEANVINLASAKNALKKLARIVAVQNDAIERLYRERRDLS